MTTSSAMLQPIAGHSFDDIAYYMLMVTPNSSPNPSESPSEGEQNQPVPEHLQEAVESLGDVALRASINREDGSTAEFAGTVEQAAAQCPFARGLDEAGFYEFVGENAE